MLKEISSLVISIIFIGFGQSYAFDNGSFKNNILFEDYKLFIDTSFKCSVVKGEINDNEISELESKSEAESDNIIKSFYDIKSLCLKNSYKESYKLLEGLVKNIKPESKEYLCEAYNLKGLILVKLKKYSEAETNFNKSLSFTGLDTEESLLVYNNLIYLYRLSNKLKNAEELEVKILPLINKSINKGILYACLAGLKAEKGLYNDAAALYLKAYESLKEKQMNLLQSRILNNLAFCYLLGNNFAEAQKFNKVSYHNYLYYMAVNYFNEGVLLEKTKQEKMALFQYIFAFHMIKNKKLYLSFDDEDRQILKISSLRMGEIYLRQGELNKAISAYDEAVNVFKEIKDNKSIIDVYKIEIEALNDVKKYDQAEIVSRKLKNLLASISGSKKITTLDNYNQILKEQRYLDEGFKYFQRGSYASSVRYLNKDEYVKIGNQYEFYSKKQNLTEKDKAEEKHIRGLMYVNSLEDEDAVKCLDFSRYYYDSKKDYFHLGHIYNHFGYLYLYVSDFLNAEKYFQHSLSCFKRINDSGNIAALKNNIGFLMKIEGRYPSALRLFKEAESIKIDLGQKEDDEIAAIYRNIASVYGGEGGYEEALKYYDKALKIDRLNGNPWGINKDLNNIANIYFIQGKYLEAYEKVKDILSAGVEIYYLTEENNLNDLTLQHILGMGKHYVGNFYKDTIELYKGVIEGLENNRKYHEEGVTLLNFSQLLFENGKKREALEAISKAVSIFENIEDLEGKWSSYYLRGRLYERMGNLKEASDNYALSVEIIEKARENILRTTKIRALYGESRFYVYEALVKVLNKLKEYNTSFEISEKARARAFLDMLGQINLKGKGKVSPELVSKEKQLRKEINGIHERIRVKTSLGKLDEVVKLKEELKDKENQYQIIIEKIVSLDEEFGTLVSIPTIRISEIKNLLDDKTALLEYFICDDKTYLWILKKNNIDFIEIPLGNNMLENKVFNLRKMLEDVSKVEEGKILLKEIYDLLFFKAEKYLTGMDNIGIIAHRSLNYLPWQALWNGKNYLVEKYSIFELPSASILKFCRMKTKELKGALLAFGNPTFKLPNLLPLPGTEVEVEKIKEAFPNSKILVKSEATEENLKMQAGKYSLIHLATHGQLNNVNPLYSRLYLASSKNDDGFLEAVEIFGLSLNTQIVVLSACETGLQVGYETQFPKGDEITGLSRAFIYAGSPRVVASLWKVADYPTADLMKNFYKYLKNNSPVKSLQLAEIETMSKYNHPYYWAPFIIVGDWK